MVPLHVIMSFVQLRNWSTITGSRSRLRDVLKAAAATPSLKKSIPPPSPSYTPPPYTPPPYTPPPYTSPPSTNEPGKFQPIEPPPIRSVRPVQPVQPGLNSQESTKQPRQTIQQRLKETPKKRKIKFVDQGSQLAWKFDQVDEVKMINKMDEWLEKKGGAYERYLVEVGQTPLESAKIISANQSLSPEHKLRLTSMLSKIKI